MMFHGGDKQSLRDAAFTYLVSEETLYWLPVVTGVEDTHHTHVQHSVLCGQLGALNGLKNNYTYG